MSDEPKSAAQRAREWADLETQTCDRIAEAMMIALAKFTLSTHDDLAAFGSERSREIAKVAIRSARLLADADANAASYAAWQKADRKRTAMIANAKRTYQKKKGS